MRCATKMPTKVTFLHKSFAKMTDFLISIVLFTSVVQKYVVVVVQLLTSAIFSNRPVA